MTGHLELDGGFNDTRVILRHNFDVLIQVMVLHKVALVVEATGANIPGRCLDTVRGVFKLLIILVIVMLTQLSNIRLECHRDEFG